AVDRNDWVSGDQLDAVLRVPVGRIDHDIVEALLTRKHGGEHDAVVIDARFGAEDRHTITGGIARQHFLYRAATGHAVTDHNQVLTSVGLCAVDGSHFHQIVHSGWSQAAGKTAPGSMAKGSVSVR